MLAGATERGSPTSKRLRAFGFGAALLRFLTRELARFELGSVAPWQRLQGLRPEELEAIGGERAACRPSSHTLRWSSQPVA